MIKPADVKAKALRFWERGQILQAWLNNESVFPLTIPCGAPSSGVLSEQFTEVRDWIAQLQQHSEGNYRIDYKTVNHRQLGPQQIPHHIVFDERNELLRFINKSRDFERFINLVSTTVPVWPQLKPWLERKPLTAVEHVADWPQLLAVCHYFVQHPRPDLYIRQLAIPNVDSKFIENHKALLSELLELILPPTALDPNVKGVAQNGFERRFGLRYDQPLIRLRMLDPDPYLAMIGLSDLSIPLGDFINLNPALPRVFITENKINGLSFPDLVDAMVIFGLGYGIQALADVAWLADKEIIYWGDIDTHGFAILSQLRSYFPQTRSIMMDEATLFRFRDLCVEEPDNKRFSGNLDHLTVPEEQLLKALQDNKHGKNLRLEQERIDYAYAVARLGRV